MGLFGLVWSIFMTGGLIKDKSTRYIYDQKKRAKTSGRIYMDSRSVTRLVSNNHICHEENRNGYNRIRDLETNEIVYDEKDDILLQQLNKYKESAIKRKTSTYRCDDCRNAPGYTDSRGIGHKYKDFKTEKEYIIKEYKGKYIYVNIITKKAERYTDYQKYSDMIKTIDNWIEYKKKNVIAIIWYKNKEWNNEKEIIDSYNNCNHGKLVGDIKRYAEEKEEEIDWNSDKIKEIVRRYKEIIKEIEKYEKDN